MVHTERYCHLTIIFCIVLATPGQTRSSIINAGGFAEKNKLCDRLLLSPLTIECTARNQVPDFEIPWTVSGVPKVI